MRDPDDSDDLAAIVRYHGASEVVDALIQVAALVYGPTRAVEEVHGLVIRRAHVADLERAES